LAQKKSCRGLAHRCGSGVLMHVVASLDGGAREFIVKM